MSEETNDTEVEHLSAASSAEEDLDQVHAVETSAENVKPKKKKNSKKKKKKATIGSVIEESTKASPVQSDETVSAARSSIKPSGIKSIEELLNQLALSSDQQQTKSMEDYRFWRTQPVTRFDEKIEDEGPIDNSKTVDEVPDTPYPLLKEFEWATIDLSDSAQMEEVFELLYGNYVEDSDASFRFHYSLEFLKWANCAPNYKSDWHVGVRVVATKKLVAFISGIPVTLRIRNTTMKSAEVNFICIHKKLRSKRLAPLLIREVTRRINKQGIWQALYTAGVVLPSPVSTCRYYHRSLNWAKLNDIGFSALPPNMTRSKMILKYKLPAVTSIPGIRLMQRSDIDQVFDLLNAYLAKFELTQVFEKEELLHWLMADYGLGEKSNDEKDPKRFIWAYVVENANGTITDMVSFYKLPSSVLGNDKHDSLNAAYAFYYASSVALESTSRTDKVATDKLATRLCELFNDILIVAKNLDFDVFNALTLLDNPLFLNELKFGAGDGFLNYYVFNYKAFPIGGGYFPDGRLNREERSGVAVVML
ncbi:acyl-CoA N-acyltransferase [Limtongia smithiae]|uniref:acyl-CoA N-acyltransferase n=1 Tax=Limtongia smithiae TaxID=1125753 RepID=UPI0034CD6A01